MSDENGEKSNRYWLYVVLVFVLIGILVFFFFYYGWGLVKDYYGIDDLSGSTPTPVATATTINEVVNITDLDNSNSELYTNQAYNYSIRYPLTWSDSGLTSISDKVTFYSPENGSGGEKIQIELVKKNVNYSDIEQWIEAQAKNGSDLVEITTDITYADLNGHEVAESESLTNQTTTYYWLCNENIMKLEYSGPMYEEYLPTFNAMTNTLIPCTE